MPRLLMSCSTLASGSGMGVAVESLSRALGDAGCDVTITGPLGAAETAVASDPTRRVQVSAHGPWTRGARAIAQSWTAAQEVSTFSRGAAPLAVHVHGVWTTANIAACSACRVHSLRYVVSPHGMLMPEAMRRSTLRKRLAIEAAVRGNLEAAAAVHVTSTAESDSVLAIAPAARTCVIPWGVNLPSTPCRRGSGDKKRLAAYIGRILPIKGVDDLADAWATVRPSGWELRFVGPDPEGYTSELDRIIRSRRLEDSVSIHPSLDRDAVARLIEGLDLLVLPSHSENFGLVVGESLAAGVPVITTTPTPWHELPHRHCGWWVPDTVASLSAAIREACALSAADLATMGLRGREWMRSSFAWPSIASRFIEELYAPR
jgi:glycosyltransferase involved in cell wall biosynthesis